MALASSTTQAPQRLRLHAPRALFWTALAVRIAVILIGRTYRIPLDDAHFKFGFEAGRIARSLAQGQGYANPFNGVSGPSAWLGPLFPLLMALAFKLFGVYTRGAAFFVMAVDSVFSALIAPAVFEVGARCFDAYGLARRKARDVTPVALWSGWLWALYPGFLQYAVHWLWEMSLSTCLFAWALVMALRLRGVGDGKGQGSRVEGRGDWGLWAGFGVLWGLEALSNSTLLICLPAVLVWVLWPRVFGARRDAGRAIAGAALACGLVGLMMMPWIVRNERTLHAFVPARSNFGVEVWNATLWYQGALPWGTAVPLSPMDPEFKLFARLGEVQYAHLRQKQAVANIEAHPGFYVKDTALRAQYFWFIWRHASDAKPFDEAVRLINYGVLSATGLLGLALALRRRVPGAWMMFWVFLLLPIPYYLVTVQARFRHPLEPLICVLTVYLFRSAESKKSLAAV